MWLCGIGGSTALEQRLDAQQDRPILIVEDDAGMRASLQFLFESYGFQVAAFAAPDEMFAGFDGLQPACAVLDIHLPGTEGIAVYEALVGRFPELRAVFITGQIDDQIRSEARRVHAVAVLEKPFSDEALLDSVGRALTPPSPSNT
jgi:FixJ family two-component response regulator